MIIKGKCKARDLEKAIKEAWLRYTVEVEPLEEVDFWQQRN